MSTKSKVREKSFKIKRVGIYLQFSTVSVTVTTGSGSIALPQDVLLWTRTKSDAEVLLLIRKWGQD